MKNLKMNQEVYNLRRNVINIIYNVKKCIPELPRVTVRITNNPSDNTLALGSIDNRVAIWIPESTAKRDDLVHIVLHELGHAVCKLKHDESCPIMHKFLRASTSLEKADFIEKMKKIIKK